jgi:hypothetical protein
MNPLRQFGNLERAMSPSFQRFARLGFFVAVICAPTVLTFGDDGARLPTPPIPTKSPPVCSPLPNTYISTYQPQWSGGQQFQVRIQFPDLKTASECQDAFVCYNYGAPGCVSASGTLDCAPDRSGYAAKWARTGSIKTNMNAGHPWVTINFTAMTPSTSTNPNPDGTGSGIIIITQGGTSVGKYVVYTNSSNAPMVLQYVQ